MTQHQEKKKLFEFKWESARPPPTSFKFDFSKLPAINSQRSWNFEANSSPFNKTFDIKEISDGNAFKFTFNPTATKESKANKTQNSKEMMNQMMFSQKPKRKIKMPQFELIKSYGATINNLDIEIAQLQSKMNKLKSMQSAAKLNKKKIETDVKQWYNNWKLWNVEDFLQWVFEEIDNGYFKTKRSNSFDVNKFTQKLNETVKRFAMMMEWNSTANMQQFEGKHLKYFDILDVKQLFVFLSGDDCRKLFTEIEKLTKSERYKNKIDESCEICTVNKKQYVLSCGHIFCGQCVRKLRVCAFCKKRIDKNKIIKVFL